MFETTPVFSGSSDAVDNFVPSAAESSQPIPKTEPVEVMSMLGTYECEVQTTYQLCRKSRMQRRISTDDERPLRSRSKWK